MRLTVLRTGTLSIAFLLAAAAATHAQSPAPPQSAPPPAALRPLTGFVPPYEIMRTVRSAGFDPLAPPLREGSTYVLRATDFRGILMRVVVDARTGAIRDANRIVPGPSRYGQMEQPPYGNAPSYGSPYGLSVYDEPDAPPPRTGAQGYYPAPPTGTHAASHPAPRPAFSAPPLPRPRPAAIASRKPIPNVSTGADNKSEITNATPTAPQKTPSVPLND